jgi:hypothetical protein
VIKDGLLVTGAEQLREIFSLHTYEISFVVYIDGFGYSMWNNKLEKVLRILYLLLSGKIAKYSKFRFR